MTIISTRTVDAAARRGLAPGLAILALLAALSATPALAQAPSRIDNVWDGRAHEPDPARVRARERADGLTNSQAEQRGDRTTEDLARKLLNEEARDRRTDPAFRQAPPR